MTDAVGLAQIAALVGNPGRANMLDALPDLAGRVGAAICTRCEELGWITRQAGSREVGVTEVGRRGFSDIFGVSLACASETVA